MESENRGAGEGPVSENQESVKEAIRDSDDGREHSRQIDIRSALLQAEELPSLDTAEADPLRAFVRRVLPRLRVVLDSRGDSGEEGEELLQQAILTLSADRRDLDSQETWSAGTLHLKSMLYWRKRQRGVCDAVDRALVEISTMTEAPLPLRSAARKSLERWIQDLPQRCGNRLRLRYGLETDTGAISTSLLRRKSKIRKATRRCLQALALLILRETLNAGVASEM